MITVVIPVYNRADLLPRLLESLKNVLSVDVEYLFVDNNCDEATRKVLDTFVADLRRQGGRMLARVECEVKQGAAAARNKGLQLADGEYVYFFDSDDCLCPDMLHEALGVATHSGADVVALNNFIVAADGHASPKTFCTCADARRHLVANNFATQSFFLRTSYAKAHAQWDESLFYWNDTEWALRILLQKPHIAWLKGTHNHIYAHPNSITGTAFGTKIDDIVRAHLAMEKDINEADIPQGERVGMLRALNLRKALYAGRIYNEGDAVAARHLLSTVNHSVSRLVDSMHLRIVFALASRGVRGAWRLC